MARLKQTIAAGLWLLGGAWAEAQSTTGSLFGEVQDASTAPLAGVQLRLVHVESGLVRTATTDAQGRYAFTGLPVGSYEVRAELQGYRPLLRRGLQLDLGAPLAVTLRLDVGAAHEEITIVADATGVNVRSSELGYLVSEQAIRDLPLNGRNYTDLAFLQPGVVAFPHRDGGSVVAHGLAASVNGQDPRSNAYLLDGTLMNDFTNGPAGSAASTALGTETVREFRVEANAYGAEFGRNSGGQVNVLTKSGGNAFHGSVFEYHRDDALDARNFFDVGEKPDFRRDQFGFTLGGPLRRDRTFFFVGYEGLRERLGRTIQTVVPNVQARQGIIPNPAQPGATLVIPVSPAVQPYLDEYPLPNGEELGGGLAEFSFPFVQTIDQDYFQVRLDQHLRENDQLFVRYTFDQADQFLPTDFPQFPRTFKSKNQFATAEYRRFASQRTLATLRLGYSRTQIGQAVEANTSRPLDPFVVGRPSLGDIDIGGIPRFGPQASADVSLRQEVFALHADLVQSRGRHLLKSGLLVERYRDDMFNPTFSLGIFTFPGLETFLRNRPLRFIGLTPEADFERRWRFTLLGGYLQDDFRVARNLTLNVGVRVEYATVPVDPRDVSLPDLMDPQVTVGPLYENPGPSVSPRAGFVWDVSGDARTALRGGYGLYYNTNSHQNLIVTVTNPPATPRPVIANPAFPHPDFSQLGALAIRPIQYDLDVPRVHVFHLGAQRELPARFVVSLGYAGARGHHLLRNTDANVPQPVTLPDGTPFHPPTAARPNAAFSTIELKSSDGRSWYNALVFEVRRAATNGLSFQSSYTWSRNIDTTQASTFLSDATNGTVSWFPEAGQPDYNKGPADYDATHNWVWNVSYELPFARGSNGLARALFADWQVAAIGQMRSGPPLTLFVQANRSRSRWSPSIGPGQGFDRPSLAGGYTPASAVTGDPDQWFDPAAFVLQPAGTYGNLGRGALTGPNLRTIDVALVKRIPWSRFGSQGRAELRIEAFNVLNRANFGIPSLTAFAGLRDGEAPLPTLGRIRSTTTAARQIQLGLRVQF
ncbi:MAG TPA: TonB-dependent receptor [Vicinamibacteria bacterium]|nr:TonB-dependent receptor [Vicinamibacteria bacterium]